MTEADRPMEIEGTQLSRCEGKRRAIDFRRGVREDPHPEIPAALLSAGHIKKYVFSTGAVAPFDATEKAGRLKKTTYEGRIGNKAYLFDSSGKMVNAPLVHEGDEELVVIAANSIVFVECDLDFRLPDFLALRFNLHIRHVHRGLLLGTGPLVDPGYWGKLCIPLHNLTDEDYLIPRTEGLIWIEFTKTSLFQQKEPTTLGRDPLEGAPKEYSEIREFIEKAARPLGAEGSTVPIRSSIPTMTARAIEDSTKAGEVAAGAEAKADGVRKLVNTIGWIGAVGIFVSIVALGLTFYLNIQSVYNSILPKVEELQKSVSEFRQESSDLEVGREIKELVERVERLENSIDTNGDKNDPRLDRGE